MGDLGYPIAFSLGPCSLPRKIRGNPIIMKTPTIYLWPEESELNWKIYRSITYMEMSPKSVGHEDLIGMIAPPKLKPSEWMPSEVQEKLTKEEQETIYKKIKDKSNASEDIVIFLKPE